MATYRCAIIGCGPRARWHADAYRRITRGELVACCNRGAERREAFSQAYGIPGYADAEEMIRHERPDLVHVVTPPTVRVELLTLIDALGVPACLVEKPVAYQVRDWRALVALEARSETRYGVGAQFRYHPALTRCRQALRSGAMGAVRFVEASAGGTICDQGVHVIDWSMSLMGDPAPVRVLGTVSGAAAFEGKHPSPDIALGEFLFENGVRGLLHLGPTAPVIVDDGTYYKHCRVAAYAERGHVLYEEFGRWEIASPEGTQQGGVRRQEDWVEGNLQAQINLTNAMFDWLEDPDRPVGTHLRRALQQWNAILGLYLSALRREPVSLPCDPPDDLWETLRQTLSRPNPA